MDAKDFVNFIGARVMLNKEAISFSKDILINNRWRKTGVLKSQRVGTVVGFNKIKFNNMVHVLWDGNKSIVQVRPSFLEIIFFQKTKQ